MIMGKITPQRNLLPRLCKTSDTICTPWPIVQYQKINKLPLLTNAFKWDKLGENL